MNYEDDFGFHKGTTGAHMSRSMMVNELATLLKATPVDADARDLSRFIVQDNILGKPTLSAREKTQRHLRRAYGLDPEKTLWRVLREFAQQEPQLIPLLGLVLIYARDAQLQLSFQLVNSLRLGQELPRALMEELFESSRPGAFTAGMKVSLAQNLNTTWTASGHLAGSARKVRTRPRTHWLATTYAMFVGYLSGIRGQGLLDSAYARLVGVDPLTAADHLATAAAHGLIRFRNAGGVVETDFRHLLLPIEMEMLHVQD